MDVLRFKGALDMRGIGARQYFARKLDVICTIDIECRELFLNHSALCTFGVIMSYAMNNDFER